MYITDVLISQFGTSFSMSGSNYYFLTCIQISQETCEVVWYSHLFKNVPQFVVIHTVQEAGQVVWYSHLFENVPQFVVIHTVKGFSKSMKQK